jgi:hypothetical protein
MTRCLLALVVLLWGGPGTRGPTPGDNSGLRYQEAARPVLPVLSFPDPELDDTAAYQGYQTRFYRDSKDNTVQIYLQPATGRVVLVWGDALNESAGFTVRDADGRPAELTWGSAAGLVGDSAGTRTLQVRLVAPASGLDLGSFVLGSMRVERDFVYAKRYTEPLATPVRVAEESLLVSRLSRLPAAEQRRHLELLHATTLAQLRQRLQPTLTVVATESLSTVRVARPSLDGVNHLGLELKVDPRRVKVATSGAAVSVRTRPGSPLRLAIEVSTDGPPLTPLRRKQIFNQAFLDYLENGPAARDSSAPDSRRLERQVRAVELLSSEEKLMAGLPNFATYFGRDMMMTALMMAPIWSAEMAEHVITSVLRKLGPQGDVSHEEALGAQAIREHAGIYDSLLQRYLRPGRPDKDRPRLLAQARATLRELHSTRENYHMIDDEFQLPVLEARYLRDSAVSSERKRAFLLEKVDGKSSRLRLILRELGLVTTKTQPYAEQPRVLNLVSFPKRDSVQWRSASWRDSDAGYAGGRFAMDINVIWVPAALASVGAILDALSSFGFAPADLASVAPEVRSTPLLSYARDRASLQRALDVWKHARSHFEVTLTPDEISRQTRAKLAWLEPDERRYWEHIVSGPVTDSLTFLALALDSLGRPIPVVNTDPATELFLHPDLDPATAAKDVAPFLRPYPVGLFVGGLGPLVANDAYASREIWERFRNDAYHGPRVVWGREVNLFLLGLAHQISAGNTGSMEDALRRTLAAVTASGLQHSELWSYRIEGDRLLPVRYGTSSDVQLWNTTSLVVQYVLGRLGAAPH